MNGNELLYELFYNEGFQSIKEHNSFLYIDDKTIGIKADITRLDTGNPNITELQFSISLQLPDNSILSDHYRGLGEDDESAFDEAYLNFLHTAADPLFSAILDIDAEDYIILENWKINNESYQAHIGNIICEGVAGDPDNAVDQMAMIFQNDHVEMPKDLFPSIEAKIKSFPHLEPITWVNFYFANIPNNKPHFYITVNNHSCEILEEDLLSQIKWEDSQEFYSFRQTIILTQNQQSNILN